jgi:hypothetical protein
MKSSVLERLSQTRNNLILQSGCTAIGALLSFWFWERIEAPAILTVQLFALLAGLVLMSTFVFRRREPTITAAAITFFFLTAITLLALWLANSAFSSETRPWAPFLGHRAFVFISAIIAPPRMSLGVIGVLLYGLAAVAQYLSWPESVRANIVVHPEPWNTLAFVFYALILFALKLRAIQLETRMTRARIRLFVAKRFARRILALKDLTNSPLQTLTMISFLLRSHHPEDKELIDCLDRCVERLVDVNRLVQEGDEHLSKRAVVRGPKDSSHEENEIEA